MALQFVSQMLARGCQRMARGCGMTPPLAASACCSERGQRDWSRITRSCVHLLNIRFVAFGSII